MAKSENATKKRGRPAKAEPTVRESAPPSANGSAAEQSSAMLGFEAKLWQAADKLRNNMDAAEYKHVVLGLIFLKYISDAFEEKHAALAVDKKSGADPEDPDEYRAENIFWVPKDARWSHLQGKAKQPTIGKLLDDAMVAIERDNPALKGVLPKDYARPALDKQRLGELIDLIGTIGLGDKANRSRDVLGRVYEYFLTRFASAEGKNGGQFYTPQCVVRVLVEMLAPYKGRVFDPCCGSGGMFVSSEKFVEVHGGRIGDVSIYGQESNHTTWRLAKLNLAIRGIDAKIAHGESFHGDAHKDLKADYVIANPPFNDSDWGGQRLREDMCAGSTAFRLPATRTSPGCSTFCITSLRLALPASCSPTAACRRSSRARVRFGRPSSRATSSTAWSRCPVSSSTRRRSRCACGSSCATRRTVSVGAARRCATVGTRRSSSMHAKWAR